MQQQAHLIPALLEASLPEFVSKLVKDWQAPQCTAVSACPGQ